MKRYGPLPVSAFFFLLASILFIPPAFSGDRFTFTAAGDYAQSADTSESLKGIALAKPALHLALGDFSYNKRPEIEWCNYVKSHIGNIPFELLAGNHESDGRNGTIDNFVKEFPDRFGAVGEYGREFYFDYPLNAPLARFILVSPAIHFKDKGDYVYGKGTARYQWLSDAIDDARTRKIRWLIVGMHKNCLSAGRKKCEIGEDVLNLLIEKKVDLILQAHDHTYQRSQQLALSEKCRSVGAGKYNDQCMPHPGENTTYPKGDGPILVIVGTAGAKLTDIYTAKDDTSYFVMTMGANQNPTKGFMKFNVSENEISGEFIRSAGGDFRDRFQIQRADNDKKP